MGYDTVWVIMGNQVTDYVDVDSIVMICITEELAANKLEWLKENNSAYVEYWIEEHVLETP